MRHAFLVVLALVSINFAAVADDEPRGRPLRVLYVGNIDTGRGWAYARFLGEKFSLVGASDRKTFDPGSVGDIDVVVLDWSQSDIEHKSVQKASEFESDLKSPLGERSRWSKPTVLLGSAGHLLAAPWKVFGGSG
ncbi:MAG TPA: hypothetical protein VKA15_22690 [Isosphaeraceae bacterium]|nr:hypothetical protein [Isosphaeraceae bacterium]